MRKLRFVNGNGTEIDLTSYPFGITTWNGFSNVDLEIQSQKVPFTDGSVYLDSLLNERDLSVTLAINDEKDLSVRYELEDTVRKVLNPKLGEGYLYYQNDYLQRRIKVIPKVPLFPTHNANDSGTVKASLSFTACSPYWEDVEETTVTINSYEQKVINNNGDVPCSIQLEGVNTNSPFRLFNNTSGKKIATKDNIALTIELNTGLGEKSFKKGSFEKEFEFGLMGTPKSITFNPVTNQYVIGASSGIWVCDDEENWYLKNGECNPNSADIGILYDEDNNNYIVVIGNYLYITEDLINLTPIQSLSGNIFRLWKTGGVFVIACFTDLWIGTEITNLTQYSEQVFTAFEKNGTVYAIGASHSFSYANGTLTPTSHGTTVYDACNNGDYVIVSLSTGLYYSNSYYNFGLSISLTGITSMQYSYLLGKWILTSADNIYTCDDLSSATPYWDTLASPVSWDTTEVKFIESAQNKDLVFVLWGGGNLDSNKLYKTQDLGSFTQKDLGYKYNAGVSQILVSDANGDIYSATGVLNKNIPSKLDIFKKGSEKWVSIYSLDNVSLQGFQYVVETGKYILMTADTMYVSDNLETWDSYSISANNFVYANGKYVFVGDSGVITTTTDFTDISVSSFVSSQNLYNINYCNGYYYIICYVGIYYSTDGIAWNTLTTHTIKHGNDYSYRNLSCVRNNILYIVNTNYYTNKGEVLIIENNNLSVLTFKYSNLYNIFYSSIYNCFFIIGDGGRTFLTKDFVSEYTLSFVFAYFLENKKIYVSHNRIISSLEIATENAISDLTTDSDMTLGLEVGENKLTITGQIDGVYYLTYRQKYLGV